MKFVTFKRHETVYYVVGVQDDTPLRERAANMLTAALSGADPYVNSIPKMSGKNVLYVERVGQSNNADLVKKARLRAQQRATELNINQIRGE